MKKISSDYIATGPGKCEICGRQVFEGMYVFNVQMRSGRNGVVHSTCTGTCKAELKSGPQKRG